MPSVVHVVTTRSFAGVERYVADVASETARRGWDVAVVGGERAAMTRALDPAVRWEPGATLAAALRSLVRVGRRDLCHVHMTAAETVAVVGRPLHRAPIVATRHFAARRGASRLGGAIAPWLAGRLTRELAVSEFVARSVERAPAAVVGSGVRPGPLLWSTASRTVLVLQRLEPEKDTATALRAWELSGLADRGWTLRVVGAGAERDTLERWVAGGAVRGVTFTGWVEDTAAELAGAGILLAPGPRDSYGLSVVEAMVVGVPVVAAAAGGHLETIGLVPDAALFPPGDAEAAAAALHLLLDDRRRSELSRAGRALALERLSVRRHVDRLLVQYELARS